MPVTVTNVARCSRFRGTGQRGRSAATLSVTVPNTVTAGNALVLIATGATTSALSAPAGWTLSAARTWVRHHHGSLVEGGDGRRHRLVGRRDHPRLVQPPCNSSPTQAPTARRRWSTRRPWRPRLQQPSSLRRRRAPSPPQVTSSSPTGRRRTPRPTGHSPRPPARPSGRLPLAGARRPHRLDRYRRRLGLGRIDRWADHECECQRRRLGLVDDRGRSLT